MGCEYSHLLNRGSPSITVNLFIPITLPSSSLNTKNLSALFHQGVSSPSSFYGFGAAVIENNGKDASYTVFSSNKHDYTAKLTQSFTKIPKLPKIAAQKH